MTKQTLPPHDLEAEEALLGALLIDPDRLERVRSIVKPEDFYRQAHQIVYSAIVALAERSEPIDIVTVRGELERTGELDAVGGMTFLASLSGSSGRAAYAEAYARTIAGKARARKVLAAAGEIAALAHAEDPEVIDKAQLKLLMAAFSSYDEYSMQLERRGLGYVATFPTAVRIEVHGLRWSGGELYGEIHVTVGGQAIHRARFNFSSTAARSTLAKTLQGRTSTKADWPWALELLCQQVLDAERRGEPFELVGRLERRSGSRYLVYPMLPLGQPSLLFADGGVGKSFISVAIACGVKAGREIVPGLEIRQKGNVLYLDWETSKEEIDERVKAVCAGVGIEPVEILYRRCSTSLVDQVEEIAGIIASENVVLVIVDSLGYALGQAGERGTAEETAIRFFSAVRHLKTTVLGIDHVKKDDAGVKTGPVKPYGSAYKTNYARSVWSMRRLNDIDGDLVLEHRKANNSRRFPPIGLRAFFTEDADGLTVEVRYERMEVPGGPSIDQQSSDTERVAAYLEAVGRTATAEEIAEATGLPRNRVYTYAGRLVQRGRALGSGEGRYVAKVTVEEPDE